MGRLGRTHIKEAKTRGQAPGLAGRLMAGHRNLMTSGRYPSDVHTGPTPSQLQGFLTPQQMLIEGAQTVGGEAGGSLAAIGTMIGQAFGLQLPSTPYQYSYGGSERAMRDQMAVNEALMQDQMLGRGESAKNLVGSAVGALERRGINLGGMGDWLKKLNPTAAGTFLQSISMVFPQVDAVMSSLDPSYVTDFSPLIAASRLSNKGKFDKTQFRQTKAWFDQAYQAGAFGRVPKQLAMHSIKAAVERGAQLGTNAMQHAINITKGADAFVQAGLAQDFGSAVAIATKVSPNVDQNPAEAIRMASRLSTLAEENGVSPQLIAKAGAAATQQGVNPMSAMVAVAHTGKLRQALGGAADEYMGSAVEAVAGFQKSHMAKVLGAAYAAGDSSDRAKIDRAIAKGDARQLSQIYSRASKNTQLQRIGHMNPNLVAHFTNRVMMSNSNLFMALTKQNALHSIRKNPALVRYLNSEKGQKDMIRRLRTKDFTGKVGRQMLAMGQGNLAALTMMSDVRPKARRVSRSAVRPDFIDPKPVARLGADFPTAEPMEPLNEQTVGVGQPGGVPGVADLGTSSTPEVASPPKLPTPRPIEPFQPPTFG